MNIDKASASQVKEGKNGGHYESINAESTQVEDYTDEKSMRAPKHIKKG